MAGILVYSPKCKFCTEVINFIQQNQILQSMVQYHNVNTHGVPSENVKRVPTMITKNSKMLVGNEIKAWLTSLLPNEIENCPLGNSTALCSLENPDDDTGDYFSLQNYGQSLQPMITPQLQDKINRNVTDAFSNGNKD